MVTLHVTGRYVPHDLVLDVDGNSSLSDLKLMIGDEIQATPSDFVVIHEGQELTMECPLSQLALCSGDTIVVRLTQRYEAMLGLRDSGVPCSRSGFRLMLITHKFSNAEKLHLASLFIDFGELNEDACHDAYDCGRYDVLKLLLCSGFPPNALRGGRTLLHVASADKATDAINVLLEHGADPEAENEHGEVPLRCVLMVLWKKISSAPDSQAEYYESFFSIARTLAAHGNGPKTIQAAMLFFFLPGVPAVIEDIAARVPFRLSLCALFIGLAYYKRTAKTASNQADLQCVRTLLGIVDAMVGRGALHTHASSAMEAIFALRSCSNETFDTYYDWLLGTLSRFPVEVWQDGRSLTAVLANLAQLQCDKLEPLHVDRLLQRCKALVRFLHDRGVPTNVPIKGETPLHYAVHIVRNLNTTEFARDLLSHGASVTAADEQQKTPLHIAAECLGGPCHADTLKLIKALLKAGASPNVADRKGSSPLHVALGILSGTPAARMMLSYSTSLDGALLKCKRTPLHIAVGRLDRGNFGKEVVELVEEMLLRGASLRADQNGETPLHEAAWSLRKPGAADIARMLVSHDPSSVAVVNHNGRSVLHAALRALAVGSGGRTSRDCVSTYAFQKSSKSPVFPRAVYAVIDMLMCDSVATAVDNSGESALHVAALMLNHTCGLQTVQGLLKAGSSPNTADNTGSTPFHVAMSMLEHPFAAAAAGMMLDHSAWLDSSSKDGRTPLHCALGNLRKVCCRDDKGLQTLDFIAGVVQTYVPGSARRTADKKGQTALHHTFASRGVTITDWTLTSLTEEQVAVITDIVTLLVSHGLSANEEDSTGKTPLLYALGWKDARLTKALLDQGADPCKPDKNWATPLHHAARCGDVGSVRELVAHGAYVDAADDSGTTPLHDASLAGHVEVVRALVEAGADCSKADVDGRTARCVAGPMVRSHIPAVDSDTKQLMC